MDVGEDTTLGDGHSGQELVQLLVVADGQLEMAWVDARLLVVTSGVAGQLEHFSGEVFEHGGEVHWGTGTNAFGVVASAEQTVKTTDWELESGTGRAGLGFSTRLGFASFTTSRHVDFSLKRVVDTEFS